MTKDVELQYLSKKQKEWEEQVALHEALSRLEKHPDFQKVIMGFLLQDKVMELVKTLGCTTPKDQTREDILEQLLGFSHLQGHLEFIHAMGNRAKEELISLSRVRNELLEQEEDM